MSTAIVKFVDRLRLVLGDPKTSSIPAYIKELHVHLGKFNEEELQEAATLIFQTQKYKSWPLPGEMLVAAEEARKKLIKNSNLNTPLGRRRIKDSLGDWIDARTKSEDDSYWSKEAFEKADKLIQSDLGRKAAHEGWIGDLYDFCRRHQRLPGSREQHKLIRCSRKTDELFAKERPGSNNYSLLSTALGRRSALARVADGQGTGHQWYRKHMEAKGGSHESP